MTFTGTFDRIVIPGEYIACETQGFAVIATLAHDDTTLPNDDHPLRQSWLEDDWHYFGIELAVWKAGVMLTKPYEHSRWGIEGNCPGEGDGNTNSYFTEVANDLLPDAVAAAKAKLAELCTI